MPFSTTLLPGKTTSSTTALSDLGSLCTIGGKRYRLVRAAASITSPAGKLLVTAVTAGVPTWSVNTSTTANDQTVVGVVPAEYVATIAANAFFLLQVAGACTVISAAAFSVGDFIGTTTTAGKAGAVTMSVLITVSDGGGTPVISTGTNTIPGGPGAIGVALAAATDVDQTVGVFLKGLG